MRRLKYIVSSIVETLLRMMPFPCKTGLIKIGHPDRNSPVLVTCNFHLTVERVKRALKGLNSYLLVANSHGINVWCAAAGGHFTSHSVISVLKTSGIDKLVDHHKIILPQLAATGVEAKLIHQKTNWKVIWGPVDAKDIPSFIERGFKKTAQQRQVKFPLLQRIEMAISWAFPISLIGGIIIFFIWQAALLPALLTIWGLAFLIFLLFPFYEKWLSQEGKRPGFIFFDFGKGGIQLILWALFLAGTFIYTNWVGTFAWLFFLRWSVVSLVIILLLSMDLSGSTPTYESGLHPERLFKITIDESKCKGATFCEQVCPRNCYLVDRKKHKAEIPNRHLCVQCGACIVQCPFDALYFKNSWGEILSPESVRKFKLNLLGARKTKAN